MSKNFGRCCLLMCAAVAATAMCGCAVYRMPSEKQLAAVKEGRKAIVLVRVTCDVNGTPYEAFSRFDLPDDNIALGIGSFETGGEVEQKIIPFLSEQTKKDGWTYFVLEPGIHYLAALPPRRTNVKNYAAQFHDAQLFRLDIPDGTPLVYAGTLHLSSEEQKSLFEQSLVGKFIADKITVANDAASARTVAAGFFCEFGDPQTLLMQPHTGPILLRSPHIRK
jgi:hypothetical protein